jgi:beta-galactosidase
MVKTVGTPARIRLTPDRSTLKAQVRDLSFVTVEVVDEEGQVVPNADHRIFFSVKGGGGITAVGNGNPVSTERYQGNQRRAHRGRCLVVVESDGNPGEIRLRAQADGLDGAEAIIRVA